VVVTAQDVDERPLVVGQFVPTHGPAPRVAEPA
jgi:hypothetical protein